MVLDRSPRLVAPTRAGIEAVAVQVPHGSAIVCGRCGCRLAPFGFEPAADGAWHHVPGRPGCDARGCTVECLDLPHRRAERA